MLYNTNMKSKEPTNKEMMGTIKEILETLNVFSGHIDDKFINIDQKFENIDQKFDNIDNKFDKIDKRLNRVESLMVTKDYLDDKLADLRGDLIVSMRKGDTKFVALLKVLKHKAVISKTEAEKILSMEPFPKVFIK